jgi:putative oxidoreductase
MLERPLNRYRDVGLLLIRVGLGACFICHGWPKLAGGAGYWMKLGQVMGLFHITFAPGFWGFAGAITEFGGGVLLMLGLFFRPACALLVIQMMVAMTMHLHRGDPFATAWSHPLEDGIVFLGLALIGPGLFSLDQVILGRRSDSGMGNRAMG